MKVEILEKEEAEIVSMREIKSFLRIENDEDDQLLQEMLKAAIVIAESYIGKEIGQKTLKIEFDNISSNLFSFGEIKFSQITEIFGFKNQNKYQIKNYFKTSKGVIIKDYYNYDKLEIICRSGHSIEDKLTPVIKMSLLAYIALLYENRSGGAQNILDAGKLYSHLKRIKV